MYTRRLEYECYVVSYERHAASGTVYRSRRTTLSRQTVGVVILSITRRVRRCRVARGSQAAARRHRDERLRRLGVLDAGRQHVLVDEEHHLRPGLPVSANLVRCVRAVQPELKRQVTFAVARRVHGRARARPVARSFRDVRAHRVDQLGDPHHGSGGGHLHEQHVGGGGGAVEVDHVELAQDVVHHHVRLASHRVHQSAVREPDLRHDVLGAGELGAWLAEDHAVANVVRPDVDRKQRPRDSLVRQPSQRVHH
mmetsp:Transcript_693/g.1807  ORF Transcript_693/g.1807 Transcript_693/m.1807 type:complete len:253 (+) Transcript_693:46-804(+)